MSAHATMQFTFLACADLKGIWDAIAMPSDIWGASTSEHQAAARDFASTFAQHCELLARNPELGVQRDELLGGLRSSTLQRCAIFYRVRGKAVEVVRVLRRTRDIEPG